MRELTKKQALELFKQAVPPTYDFYDCDHEVTRTPDGWTLTVRQMYTYVPFDAEQLFKVCELFDTMNVNDSRYHTSGCETCDYGSSYELTLYVKDGKPFPATHPV